MAVTRTDHQKKGEEKQELGARDRRHSFQERGMTNEKWHGKGGGIRLATLGPRLTSLQPYVHAPPTRKP